MPTGLEIFDQNGVVRLDGTTRCGRVRGCFPVGGSTGSQAVDLSGGTPFWSFLPDFLFKHISNDVSPPQITVDANGVYWTYSPAATPYGFPITGYVVVGVF